MIRKRVLCSALACSIALVSAGCKAEGQVSSTGDQKIGSAVSGTISEGAFTMRPETETLETAGKLRMTYTGRRSSVQYVTSPDQLPAYSELERYDTDWFTEHALVLVTETVSSGSTDVEITSITVNKEQKTAVVTLSHSVTAPGVNNTQDMATWLLWAEVDTGLDELQWSIDNPALQSDRVTS